MHDQLSISPQQVIPAAKASKTAPSSMVKIPSKHLPIQRKCNHCEEEENDGIAQRKPLIPFIQKKENSHGDGNAGDAVTNQINATKGGGESMDKQTQSFMESRFGTSFQDVRIHTGSYASELSQQLNAQAFTVGNNVYFNQNKYAPDTNEGKHLLAHELTHTIQQSNFIQRKIKVHDPNLNTDGSTTVKNWEEVRKQIQALDPGFDVNSAGDVLPISAASCGTTKTQTRDKCLCGMTSSANTWEIIISNNDWPHTDQLGKSVTVQNSFSKLNFGAWGGNAQKNTRVMQSKERVLGHELCGHAFLFETGTHPDPADTTSASAGRPSHEVTVKIENKIADEIAGTDAPDRGVFADPHQGESFSKISFTNYGHNEFDVNKTPDRTNIMVIKRFMEDSGVIADVIGHSDSVGSNDEIMHTSTLRASDVRNTLIREGIKPSQFRTVKGVGNAECTTTSLPDPLCRKVDVFMFIFEAASIGHP